METAIVALITGVVGVITGHISARAQRHTATEETYRSELDHLLAPYDSLAKRAAQLETDAHRLNRQVQYLIQRDIRWQAGWDEIVANWEEARQQPEPPPYPVHQLEPLNSEACQSWV